MDKLDRLLKDWADQREVSQEKLKVLRANILSAAKNLKPEPRPKGFSLGIYIGLGLAVLCFLPVILRQPPPRVKDGAPAIIKTSSLIDQAGISKQDLENSLKTLREMNHVFSGNMRWVRKSENGMDFQLVEGERVSEEYVVIRFMIFEKKPAKAWEKTAMTEVTAMPEDIVEVPLDGKAGNVRFWAHILPDGPLAVDSAVRFNGSTEQSTAFSGVFKQGQPQKVFSMTKGDTQYCVFESVSRLPGVLRGGI
jgi:hypothetical protein